MATYTQGPLGGFSGKIGPVVGTSWRGKQVMRSMPDFKSPKYSAAQLLQQQRLKLVQDFLRDMKWLLCETFGSQSAKNPPYNNAMSYHMKEALITTAQGLEINYPRVLISKGDLCAIEQAVLEPEAAHSFRLNWLDNSSQALAYPNDHVLVVAYAPTLHAFEYFINDAQREDGTIVLNFSERFYGVSVALWVGFYNHERKVAATSRYLGTVVV